MKADDKFDPRISSIAKHNLSHKPQPDDTLCAKDVPGMKKRY